MKKQDHPILTALELCKKMEVKMSKRETEGFKESFIELKTILSNEARKLSGIP